MLRQVLQDRVIVHDDPFQELFQLIDEEKDDLQQLIPSLQRIDMQLMKDKNCGHLKDSQVFAIKNHLLMLFQAARNLDIQSAQDAMQSLKQNDIRYHRSCYSMWSLIGVVVGLLVAALFYVIISLVKNNWESPPVAMVSVGLAIAIGIAVLIGHHLAEMRLRYHFNNIFGSVDTFFHSCGEDLSRTFYSEYDFIARHNLQPGSPREVAYKLAGIYYRNLEIKSSEIFTVLDEYLKKSKKPTQRLNNKFVKAVLNTELDKKRITLKSLCTELDSTNLVEEFIQIKQKEEEKKAENFSIKIEMKR